MAGFSPEDIQRVREANDLVSVVGDRVPVRQTCSPNGCR